MKRIIIWLALLLCTSLLAGCTGKPFNVKPHKRIPIPSSSERMTIGSLEIEAAATRDENLLMETFDANLMLAGLLPVTIKLTNRESNAIDLAKISFMLTAPSGQTIKPISGEKAFRRLVSYYEVSAYSRDGYRQSIADFRSYEVDFKRPIAAGETVSGLLFFDVGSREVFNRSLRLIVSYKRQGANLKADLGL